MKGLIRELKEEHAYLTSMFNEINNLDIGVGSWFEKIITLERTLTDHLNKEDEKLYPLLRSRAKKDSALKYILTVFANDMELVTKKSDKFFQLCKKKPEGGDLYIEYGTFYASLKERIAREEKVLFAEYEKCCSVFDKEVEL